MGRSPLCDRSISTYSKWKMTPATTPSPEPLMPQRLLLAVGFFLVMAWLGYSAEPERPLPKDHAEQMSKGLDLFKKGVRQTLVDKCLKCHGGKSTEGEFDLSTRELLLKGGKSGVAILSGRS